MSKIQVHREGPVAVLTIDDGKANTFEQDTFAALERALAQATTDCGALVLTGREGFFSAGLDLKVVPSLPHEERVETIRAFGRALIALFSFPRPTIAAVSGHALGAGAMLALAADVRIISDKPSRFALNEVSIGMVVPTFGVEIARAAASPSVLAELVLHGRIFSPTELLARGLVEAVLPATELLPAAIARAQALATLPSAPYAETKNLLHGAAAKLASARLDQEAAALVGALEGR